MTEAVRFIDGNVETEASGGITEENIIQSWSGEKIRAYFKIIRFKFSDLIEYY